MPFALPLRSSPLALACLVIAGPSVLACSSHKSDDSHATAKDSGTTKPGTALDSGVATSGGGFTDSSTTASSQDTGTPAQGGSDATAPTPSDSSAPSPTADSAPAPMEASGPACPGGPPSATTAPMTIDVSCFTSSFDDEFQTYDISSGPTSDGMYPNERWFNGTEQCCLSPSGGAGSANYPTPGPNGPVNPYSILPGGGLQIQMSLQNNTWFSGVMTSADQNGNGFAQQYGYFEFKVQLAPGTGTWPGLWLLPSPMHTAGGEIDVLEQYGLNPPLDPTAYTEFHVTLHDWTNSQPSTSTLVTGQPDLTAGYHAIGMLWNENYMAFYVDGNQVWNTPTLNVMKGVSYYLLADMGLGSGWDTSQTPNPSNMLIQYIRAYTVPGF